MSATKRLMTNTISMFIVQALQPFLTILLVFIIGRTLGPELFGKYTIVFQIFSIFQITCSLGLKTLLTREIATQKANANKLLINGMLLGVPASLLNIIIVVFVVFVLDYKDDVAVGIYLVAISLIATSLADVFAGVLTGFEEVKKIAYAWLFFLIFKTLISIAALLFGYGLYALIIVHVVAKFILAIHSFYFIFRLIGKPKLEIDYVLCKKLIRMGWSLALLAISMSLFWRIDVIMLSKMVSDEMVGNFGAAYKIFHFILMSVRSFSLAFLPMISSMYVERRKDFRKACRKALRYLTILVLPIAIITTYAAPQIMPLLWGDKFDNALVAQVLQLMSWSLLPFAITEVFGSALIASEKQVIHFILKTVSLAIKILLNYYLTVRYGVIGPAISTVIAMMILVFLQFPFVIPKLIKFKKRSVLEPLLKLTFILAVVGYVFYLFKNSHFIIGISILLVIYVSLVWIMKLFTNEDKKYFSRLKKKKRNINVMDRGRMDD